MCEADLEKALSSLETYRHDLKERDNRLHQLTSELHTHCTEKDYLQKVIDQNQHSQEQMCQEFKFRMFGLQVSEQPSLYSIVVSIILVIILEHYN